MTENSIQLSIVVTSRNDNHGKNLLYRMQHFVDGFIEQCKRHDVKSELIIVEWNPPNNTAPLANTLHFPTNKSPCTIRIIQVPGEIHSTLDNADKIPLFQMIAKNVGIRRAKGKFVLATNIDILFSDELFRFIKTKLKKGFLYRADRLDVPEQLPSSSDFNEILKFCSSEYFRINGKLGTVYKTIKPKILKEYFCQIFKGLATYSLYDLFKSIYSSIYYLLKLLYSLLKSTIHMNTSKIIITLQRPVSFIKKLIRKVICAILPKNTLILHTNACGDFTLLSYEDWEKLKGYPEWAIFSWHIDSVLLYQARQNGIREIDLPKKFSIYHIEHEIGSGYSPEGAHTLFNRLAEKNIPYLSNSDLNRIIHELNTSKENKVYNQNNWGFADISLNEFII